jgi:hypothetical protein
MGDDMKEMNQPLASIIRAAHFCADSMLMRITMSGHRTVGQSFHEI